MFSANTSQVSADTVYIEDVFSTWLYTGNGSTQTITNGIDLAGKGGLVWSKSRGSAINHALYDTVRGNVFLASNSTAGNTSPSISGVSFSSSGYNLLGADGNLNNTSFNPYASWTFREQPKFFDIVTWTGNAATPRTITHNLGSVPGCIIVKKYIGTAEDWFVFHRSMGNTGTFQYFCILNSTAAQDTGGYGMEKASSWTSTTFSLVSAGGSSLNESGATYVAYLFAHNAGGFGLSGTDNVISCGSYTGNGSATGPTITLGYEPQWLMIKNASGTGNWNMIDNMRGMPVGSADAFLRANTLDAEATADWVSPTATGFNIVSTSSEVNTNTSTYIYIAIRRGPMKVPTSGTSVYSGFTGTTTANQNITAGFPVDLGFWKQGRNTTNQIFWQDRLRGNFQYVQPDSTAAEATFLGSEKFDVADGVIQVNAVTDIMSWFFRRAPGFFDEVCFTGDGSSNRQIPHNLGVVPEFTICKSRNATGIGDSDSKQWIVRCVYGTTNGLYLLNANSASQSWGGGSYWPPTATWLDTSSNLNTGSPTNGNQWVNGTGELYVAYLFATCPGVSKVGSYTGTNTTKQVDCGFTGGARFVLIKRTDSTGDWYVWDTARGIVSGNDPYLLLNSIAAEVTNTDYIDTYSAGFEISSTAPAAINANGGSFIFLAIA